ncbi:hypothetical protein [Comamonas antarctica]|uniref:hypothetical protein n=1 Tax=Comamonas antarctica TaxID=2743470 RepID=UPI0028EC85D7|nr:hypothetical protein [Comamonas antarctica]
MEETTTAPPVIVPYRGYEIWVFAQDDGIPVGAAVILKDHIQVMSIPPSRFENILLAENQILRYAEYWVDQRFAAASLPADPLRKRVRPSKVKITPPVTTSECKQSKPR